MIFRDRSVKPPDQDPNQAELVQGIPKNTKPYPGGRIRPLNEGNVAVGTIGDNDEITVIIESVRGDDGNHEASVRYVTTAEIEAFRDEHRKELGKRAVEGPRFAERDLSLIEPVVPASDPIDENIPRSKLREIIAATNGQPAVSTGDGPEFINRMPEDLNVPPEITGEQPQSLSTKVDKQNKAINTLLEGLSKDDISALFRYLTAVNNHFDAQKSRNDQLAEQESEKLNGELRGMGPEARAIADQYVDMMKHLSWLREARHLESED